MKRERKTISSLLGYEIAHGSTVDQDLDRSVVEGAVIGERILGKGFVKAADFNGRFLGRSYFLVRGPGFQEEGLGYRACLVDLQRGLGFFGD